MTKKKSDDERKPKKICNSWRWQFSLSLLFNSYFPLWFRLLLSGGRLAIFHIRFFSHCNLNFSTLFSSQLLLVVCANDAENERRRIKYTTRVTHQAIKLLLVMSSVMKKKNHVRRKTWKVGTLQATPQIQFRASLSSLLLLSTYKVLRKKFIFNLYFFIYSKKSLL